MATVTSKKLNFTADSAKAGMRLDKALAEWLPDYSRSHLQKLIKLGVFALNGAKTELGRAVLKIGDQVTGELPDETVVVAAATDDALDIVFEDFDLLIINKPAGLIVHRGAGTKSQRTLADMLAARYGANLPGGEHGRAGIVHRLDKDTTGLMVCTKTAKAHAQMSRLFKERLVTRRYIALTFGKPVPLEIETYLRRDTFDRRRFVTEPYPTELDAVPKNWRYAKTDFIVRELFNDRVAVVEAALSTGRTHQIRIHALACGAPVLGDKLYGDVQKLHLLRAWPKGVVSLIQQLNRQLLHSAFLEFMHPITNQKVSVFQQLPPDMQAILNAIRAAGLAGR
jgi:23S rRNA pseudouridine1911/1915/1917 synthase